MNTISYRGWWIHMTFLSESIRPSSVENGIRVVSPSGVTHRLRTKSLESAKRYIRRKGQS